MQYKQMNVDAIGHAVAVLERIALFGSVDFDGLYKLLDDVMQDAFARGFELGRESADNTAGHYEQGYNDGRNDQKDDASPTAAYAEGYQQGYSDAEDIFTNADAGRDDYPDADDEQPSDKGYDEIADEAYSVDDLNECPARSY